MSFCKHNCGTGFQSVVERETHEQRCELNPDMIEARIWVESLTAQERIDYLTESKVKELKEFLARRKLEQNPLARVQDCRD